MIAAYYFIALMLALVLMIVYLFSYHKHFDMRITLLFVLVPVSNLGNVLLENAQSLEAALVANKVVYIGACYMQLISMLAVFSLCRIKLNRWIRTGLVLLSTIVYLSSLTMGYSPLFYEEVSFSRAGDTIAFDKKYGPIHTVFIAMVVVMIIALLVWSHWAATGGRLIFPIILIIVCLIPFVMDIWGLITYGSNSGE